MMTATDAKYRIRRRGRDEFLNDRAEVTANEAEAATFRYAMDAALFMIEYLEDATLWYWEPVPPASEFNV